MNQWEFWRSKKRWGPTPGLSSKRTKPAPWNRYPFSVGRNCSHVQHDAMATNTKTSTLQTSWATVLTEPPWAEHPRPQLRRASWKTLNGWWRCRTVEVAADSTKNEDFEEMLKVRDAWLELVLTWKFGRYSALKLRDEIHLSNHWFSGTLLVSGVWQQKWIGVDNFLHGSFFCCCFEYLSLKNHSQFSLVLQMPC